MSLSIGTRPVKDVALVDTSEDGMTIECRRWDSLSCEGRLGVADERGGESDDGER